MKKVVTITLVVLVSLAGSAQVRSQQRVAHPVDEARRARANVLSDSPAVVQGELPLESFEAEEFPPAGWTKITNFGGSGWERVLVGSIIDGFQDNQGDPVPLPDSPPQGGDAVAMASWVTGDADGDFTTGQQTDQWLITPQITDVQQGDSLVFYLKYFLQFGDNLDVLLSTTGGDSTKFFTILVTTISFSGPGNNDWQRFAFALTDFVDAGSDIFVAFRERVANTSNSGDALFLDLVEVLNLITSVQDDHPAVPGGFSLHQNYPNPFNPTTNITFTVPQQTAVNLEVYNVLGQRVASLLHGEIFAAGEHTLRFDGAGLANGIYYYRLQAGDFRAVRKMILLK
ncbi:MAG: T9SS C-terminal target domain-containing protein [Calditrichaeota bacterium]|nr:MAG: T9SS C-terminal target domain-containing protein [Calditrichota bacterium]